MTPDALNHRFRKLRAEAVIVNEARSQGGYDMRDLPTENLPKTQQAVDKKSTLASGDDIHRHRILC